MTVSCVGIGCAIDSGIFAAPGDVAVYFRSPWAILLIWVFFGGITLVQSLVTAELATRFPKAGGEYQYLKMAYGEFAAFFFGWSFTIFIIGGGAGTIAALLGEFAADLLRCEGEWADPVLGVVAIVSVVIVNVLGLRTGAVAQNCLTILKTLALLGIAIGAMIVSGHLVPASSEGATVTKTAVSSGNTLDILLLALLSTYWSFAGVTDPAKLAEEVTDVRRSLPRALIASAGLLTLVYCLYNYALLCAISPGEMAGEHNVPSLIFGNVAALPVSDLILGVSIVICLGAISSTLLANVRVTFALARDGLTFRFLDRMSKRQSPVPALIVSGAIACLFVLNRSFQDILRIYFLGSAFLFGLTYFSLIVFRRRDKKEGRAFPSTAYRLPAGCPLAVFLVLFEIGVAATIIRSDIVNGTYDSLSTLALLAVMAFLYFVWRRIHPAKAV